MTNEEAIIDNGLCGESSVCVNCNFFHFDLGCLNSDDLINCPLYIQKHPGCLQDYEDNIRAFEKSVSKSGAEEERPQLTKSSGVFSCSDCILDGTDACSRGAGRAVDDKICEDFMEVNDDDA